MINKLKKIIKDDLKEIEEKWKELITQEKTISNKYPNIEPEDYIEWDIIKRKKEKINIQHDTISYIYNQIKYLEQNKEV